MGNQSRGLVQGCLGIESCVVLEILYSDCFPVKSDGVWFLDEFSGILQVSVLSLRSVGDVFRLIHFGALRECLLLCPHQHSLSSCSDFYQPNLRNVPLPDLLLFLKEGQTTQATLKQRHNPMSPMESRVRSTSVPGGTVSRRLHSLILGHKEDVWTSHSVIF